MDERRMQLWGKDSGHAIPKDPLDPPGETGFGDVREVGARVAPEQRAPQRAGPVLQTLVPEQDAVIGIEHENAHRNFVQDVEAQRGSADVRHGYTGDSMKRFRAATRLSSAPISKKRKISPSISCWATPKRALASTT